MSVVLGLSSVLYEMGMVVMPTLAELLCYINTPTLFSIKLTFYSFYQEEKNWSWVKNERERNLLSIVL